MNRSIASGSGQPGARAALERGPSSAALAARSRPPLRPIPVLVRRALLLFVATMPFTFAPRSVSLVMVSGVLFFGCCLWYPKTCFPRPAPAVLWFWGHLMVYVVLGLFIQAELRGQLSNKIRVMIQLILLFWVTSALLQNSNLVRRILFVFGAATSGLATGVLLNVPGFAGAIQAGGGVKGTRMTAVGYSNPNDLAFVIAIGAVMLIGLLLDNTRRTRGMTWLLRCLVIPLLVLLVGTSSRGGLMSFSLGMSMFLLPMAPSRRRIAAFGLGLFALIALGVMIARDPVAAARWTQTYEEGRVAGRDAILGKAIPMFLERPVLGWGPVEFLYELGSRLNEPTLDPHNGFLWVLLEVGLVGALFFFAGFGLCFRAAWKSRAGPEGTLPLALMVTAAVMNFSGTYFATRLMWLVFGIALASPVVSAKWRRAVSAENGRLAVRA